MELKSILELAPEAHFPGCYEKDINFWRSLEMFIEHKYDMLYRELHSQNYIKLGSNILAVESYDQVWELNHPDILTYPPFIIDDAFVSDLLAMSQGEAIEVVLDSAMVQGNRVREFEPFMEENDSPALNLFAGGNPVDIMSRITRKKGSRSLRQSLATHADIVPTFDKDFTFCKAKGILDKAKGWIFATKPNQYSILYLNMLYAMAAAISGYGAAIYFSKESELVGLMFVAYQGEDLKCCVGGSLVTSPKLPSGIGRFALYHTAKLLQEHTDIEVFDPTCKPMMFRESEPSQRLYSDYKKFLALDQSQRKYRKMCLRYRSGGVDPIMNLANLASTGDES